MGVKNVNRKILYSIALLCISIFSFAQEYKVKYLLFDSSKDSVVEDYRYYKIDNNLFDIGHYNQIDTLTKKQIKCIKLTSVKKLRKSGAELFLKVSEDKNLFIETYNEIFENIYILEKISNNKYKRTRVWWVDYENGCF